MDNKMGSQRSRSFVALALLTVLSAPTTFSAPFTAQESCSPVCRKSLDSSKLKYAEGTSYVYNFDTKVTTTLVGTTDEESIIKVKGQAVISAQSSCDFILTVQQSVIEGQGGKRVTGENELEGSSIRFGFQDGAVEGICTETGESTWVTNFKRALVSMFQNRAIQAIGDATVREVDISGHCPTEYTFSGTTFTKTRDLNKCSYREGGKWILQGIPYSSFSDSNSNPIVDSGLTCTQELSSAGIFKTIKCLETNKLKPLSSGQAGAQTIVDSKLTLTETKSGILALKSSVVFSPSAIFFDHSDADTSAKTRRIASSNSNELLTKLCTEISSGTVSSKVPGLFLELKNSLRSGHSDEFSTLYSKIQDGTLCSNPVGKEKLEKLFIDAALVTASTGSVVLLTKLVGEGKLPIHTQQLFVLVSSFIARPQEPALTAFRTLLANPDINNNNLLAASGLAHQYCKTTNPECASNSEYSLLAESIAKIAGDNCATESVDSVRTKNAVTALQALGNLDALPIEAVRAISTCLESPTVSNRMKIRAFDSFRGDPCQKDLKSKSYSIFRNKELPSEVRIHAYLSSVRCFEQDDVDTLQKILNEEDSNQVGAFITSHIANILSSSSPGKRGIQAIFKQIRITKSFPSDPRIFSRNYELSAFSTEKNVGFSGEGSFIFAKDSYIPRTTTGNITVDVFGRSYQLFEYGLYLENFEKLFETYFGPNGLFSKNPQTEVVKELQTRFSSLQSDVASRFRRDTSGLDLNDIDSIHNEVSGAIKTRYSGSGGFGDIYVRSLGQAVFSESFTQEEISRQSLSKSFLDILDKVLEGAKDHSVEVTEPITFMNDELVLPTISGFPLNLQFEGTSVLSLQLQGKLDVVALLGGRGTIGTEVKSRVLPSAATIIRAKMSVGAGPIESGLQLEGKIHTSSGIDVAISRQATKFEFTFNIPEEKIQLVDLNTELFWISQTGGELVIKSPLKSKLEARTVIENQCTEALSAVTGLKFCAQVRIPTLSADSAPLFPLTGDTVVALSMKKVDSAMEGYYLKIDTGSESGPERSISIVMDSPGSKTNRKITADGRIVRGQSPKLELDISSPWSKVRIDYQRWNEALVQGMELTAKADEMVISGIAKLNHQLNGDIGVTYEPIISYSFMGPSVNLLEGKITRVFGKTMDIDLRANGMLKAQNGKISGSIKIDRKDSRNADFALTSIEFANDAIGKLLLDGTFGLKENGNVLNLNAKYGEAAEHDLTLSGEYSEPTTRSKIFDLKVSSTRREFLNFDIRYESARSPTGFENNMVVHRGSDVGTRLTLSQSSKYSWESSKLFDIENLLEIKYPKRSVDFYLKADAKNGPVQSANFQLRSGRSSNAVVKYDATGDDLSTYDLIGSLNFPGIQVKFSEIAKKLSPEQWTYKSSFTSEREGQSPFNINSDTDLTLRFRKSDILSQLAFNLSSSAFTEPFLFNSKVNGQADFYVASLKLGQPSGEILNLGTEFRTALGNKPSTISSKAFVFNYLDANLVGKQDRGISNLNVDINWLPTGRQITVASDLRRQGQQYNFNTDLKWDATRDQSKTANIKNTISFPNTHLGFQTTHNFIIQGRSSQLVFNGKLANDYFNGENVLDIKFQDARSTSYAFGFTNVNENRDKTKASDLAIKLDLPSHPHFELKLTNRAANIDFTSLIFELSSDLKIDYKENLNFQAELNSALTNKRSISGKLDVSGSAISQPIRFDHTSEIQTGRFKLAASGKRGAKAADLALETSFDIWSPKKTLEYSYKVNTPFAAFRNIELNSKYSYLFTQWTNFDYAEAGSLILNNGNPSSWDNAISFLGQEFQARYNITAEGNSVVALGLTGRALPKKITLKLHNSVKGGDMKFTIESERNFPNVNLRVAVVSPYKDYENMDFRIRHKVGQIYETDIQAKRLSSRFTVTSKLEYSSRKKSVDLLVSGDNLASRKVYLSLVGPDSDKYAVDVVFRWGDDGKIISSKGALLRSGESVVGDLSLDSPVLNAEGWNVHITKDVTGGRQKVAISVKNAEEETGHLILDYAQKGDSYLTLYDGKVSVKANTINFEGDFELHNKIFQQNRDGEEGREIKSVLKFDTENYPIKLEFIGKRSNANSKFSAAFCNEGDQDCKIMEFSWLTRPNDYTISATSKSITLGRKPEADTFLVRTVRNGNNYEHFVKLRSIGAESEQEVGYKIFRYPDISSPKAGFEFWLPGRKVSILGTKEQSQYMLEAWTNKNEKPDEKLAVIFTKDSISRADDASAWGREMSVVLQHPLLKKDLRVKTRALYGGTKTVADMSVEIDVFNSGQELNVNFKVDRDLRTGSNSGAYIIDLRVDSKAQGLSASVHSDIRATGTEFATKSKFVYLNREKQQRNYEIVLDYLRDRRVVQVTGPTGRIISYASSYTFHILPGRTTPDGYDVRREIYLPGMADTRIFQNSLSTSFPPSAHIKMFTVQSPPGEFYEAWIGFKNDKNFAAGIYGHEEQGQFVLTDFNIALNNSRLLFLKADWDYQNIKQFLEKAQTRLQDTAGRFKALSGASVDYLTKEIDYQTSTLLKSLPTLRPLLQAYKAQIIEVSNEVQNAEIVQSTADYFELVLNIFGTDYEELREQFDQMTVTYVQLLTDFQEFLDKVPEMVMRTINRIPAAWNTVQQSASFTFDTLVATTSSIMESIADAVDRLSKANPAVANNIGILSDTTQGIGKYLKESLTGALRTLTELWTSVKMSTEEFLESEYVKTTVMDLMLKYEHYLGNAIDGYKKQADALRETILKTLPDKEFRELVQTIMEYVEKKAKKETVDDALAQREIYAKFVAAIEKAGSNIFTVDLANGLIVAQVLLPVPVKSLLDMNQVFAISLPVKSTPKWSFLDAWNKLRSIHSLRDLLPPLESYAYIVGSQYYRTFDGKFNHFEGNCQYLLAADFAEKNFTIVVDFQKDTGSEVKKSIIMTDSKNVAVIRSDNTVHFNGKLAEAIYEGEYRIFQSGDWVSVEFGKSFIVECSKVQDVCSVQVNGFYLGKTRGLFGTYNHETSDDLMAPSGVIQDTFERMVPLWKVNRQCQERPLPTHSQITNLVAIEKCRDAFGDSSSLGSCFGTENPSEYETVCAALVDEKGYDLQRAVCTAAYAYAKTCQNSGVDVDSSKFCSK